MTDIELALVKKYNVAGPRYTSYPTAVQFRESGVEARSGSLGVQDPDPDVQEVIHRVQPFELTARVTRWLRQEGINAVNFDLIYGLPHQTQAGFEKTMDDVLQLTPDRYLKKTGTSRTFSKTI